MRCEMIVYESESYRTSHPDDTIRFYASVARLADVGISLMRVMCSSPDDIGGTEASEVVAEKGMAALPVTECDGAVVCEGSYPSDQELADYLEVPDGVLSTDMSRPPPRSELAYPCGCVWTR